MKKAQSKDATCCVSTRTAAINRVSTKGPKERSILMKPFLIEAIMNTKMNTWPPQPINPDKPHKGMTRRIIKPASKNAAGFVMTEDYRGNKVPYEIDEHERMFDNPLKCPYGQPGDLLWVKETHQPASNSSSQGNEGWYYKLDFHKGHPGITGSWRSPLFMPKCAARIWLQIVDIRPERLQDISDEDCVFEGLKWVPIFDEGCDVIARGWRNFLDDRYHFLTGDGQFTPEQRSFGSLISMINGPDTWRQNPWVWVISFRVVSTTGRPDPAQLPVLPGLNKSSENH